MLGETISHYEIIEKLGEGGMGVVYRARDTKLNRDVALKFLPAGVTSDVESRKRFVREAQAAAALNHPNICAVYEIGEADGHTFIVMPCIGGASLADRIKEGPLPVDEALDIAIQVGKGLARAHDNGIVHRDIKPGNILIDEHGLVKIVDFGLAKLGSVTKMTMAGTTLGTVSYMSPEQATGSEVDHRADIWALGVVLYEMLTGSKPFRGEVDAAVIYSLMNEEPGSVVESSPGTPEDIETIIFKALAKDPEERFRSASDMVEVLEAVRGGENVPTMRRPAGRAGNKVRRQVVAVAALLVLAVVIVGYILLKPGQSIGSVAVLPLMDLSGESEDGGFADGLTGALRGELGQIPEVDWTSLHSVMRFKGSEMTVTEFCDRLGVEAAVVGTVARDSSRVVLSLQLVDGDSEREIWSKEYECGRGELNIIYSRVALDLAEHLHLAIARDAAAAMASRKTVDPEVNAAYLRGNYYLRNANDLEEALKYFKMAIDADPTFAKGWAGLAETYIRRSHGGTPMEGAVEMATAAVDQALELDNTLGEAYITRAHIMWEHTWDQEGAAEAFRKGFELNPSDAWGHIIYAYYLQSLGEFEKAAEMAIRATELDPLSVFINCIAAVEPIAMGGSIDDATEYIDNLRELFPDNFPEYRKHKRLSDVYYFNRKFDRAIEEYNKCIEIHTNSEYYDSSKVDIYLRDDAFNLARIHLLAGNRAEAESLWTKHFGSVDLEELGSGYPTLAAEFYIWYKADLDKAFEILDKAYEDKNWMLTRITVHPCWEPIRSDPRYDRLVKGMGLR